MKNRNIEIDFLRGIAILMVVIFHFRLIPFFNRVGWMGVDLFFVLSGYLVSGLLFKEYIKYSHINGKLFLIRRGFKIYPTFYIFLLIGIIIFKITDHQIKPVRFLFDGLFIKNYLGGVFSHLWSLCVEEHFYIIVTIGFYFLAVKKKLGDKKLMNIIFIFIFIICLLNRMMFVQFIPIYKKYPWLVHVQTHFRMDSLMFGTFIAWHMCFNKEKFIQFFRRYSAWIIPVAIIILLPALITAPGTTNADNEDVMQISFAMRTMGYTSLYLGFGLILIYMITKENIGGHLSKFFSKPVVKIISETGIYSYSIYLFHPLIRDYLVKNNMQGVDYRIVFVIYLIASCIIGALISRFIEYYFLKIRDKYWPSRSEGKAAVDVPETVSAAHA